MVAPGEWAKMFYRLQQSFRHDTHGASSCSIGGALSQHPAHDDVRGGKPQYLLAGGVLF